MPKVINHDEIKKEFEKLKMEGYSQRKAAAVLGVSPTTLWHIVKGKVQERKASVTKQKILSYHFENKLGFSDISKIIDCSRQYVHQVVVEHKRKSII